MDDRFRCLALVLAEPLAEILRQLAAAGVRFVVIGVGGANYYARAAGGLFATQDRDLFFPPDPQNLLACWQKFLALGWEL